MTRRSTGPMPSWPRITAAWSTRPGRCKPRDKARVERPMPYVRDSFWRGREFASAGADAGRGGPLVAGGGRAAGVPAAGRRRPGRGVRRGREGRAAAAARRSVRAGGPGRRCKVGPDIHAQVGKTLVLGAVAAHRQDRSTPARPPRWCSSSSAGELVKTHARKPQGKQTDFGDYPPEKIAFHMRTPAWCRRQAAGIGPACEQRSSAGCWPTTRSTGSAPPRACSAWPTSTSPAGSRPPARRPTAAGDPSYRTVKGILAAGTERHASRRAGRGRRRGRVPARPRRLFAADVPTSSRCAPPAAPRRRHDRPHHEHARS